MEQNSRTHVEPERRAAAPVLRERDGQTFVVTRVPGYRFPKDRAKARAAKARYYAKRRGLKNG